MAPNSADIPSSEYGPVDDDDSDLSDICITDDEDDAVTVIAVRIYLKH